MRLWKVELQQLADETGLRIAVCHFPPGTSKWNKIEHRLFSFITQNWRGKPLVSHEVIVKLIAATTTKTGLKVRSEIDTNSYPAGIKVADAELARVNLQARIPRRLELQHPSKSRAAIIPQRALKVNPRVRGRHNFGDRSVDAAAVNPRVRGRHFASATNSAR